MNCKLTVADFAEDFARCAHLGQKRKNGDDYFTHPQRVAELVSFYKGDSNEINILRAAAFCHDLLEDTEITYYDLVQTFGYQVSSLVLELTTNPEMKRGIGNKAEYLSYKCSHMTHWALVIKLCDRLDNLTDMRHCETGWRERYIHETEHIISYLYEHRELTRTHQIILKDLAQKLFLVKGELKMYRSEK